MRTFLSTLVWAYWTVVFHFCLVLVTILFVITYPFDRYRKIPNRVLKLLAWLVIKPIPTWCVEIRGADYGKIHQPTIVVANHQSFLDIPLLYLLPWRMKWVTKKNLLRIPVLGWLTAMTGHIPIDRKSLQSFRAMDALVQPIQAGIPGMIFPEGTRTTDGSMKKYKKGAFVLAKKYNFRVLPVVLEGGYEAMPSGSWKFNFKKTFVISVLEPLDPAEFEDSNKLKDFAQQQIKDELKSMQKENDIKQ